MSSPNNVIMKFKRDLHGKKLAWVKKRKFSLLRRIFPFGFRLCRGRGWV